MAIAALALACSVDTTGLSGGPEESGGTDTGADEIGDSETGGTETGDTGGESGEESGDGGSTETGPDLEELLTLDHVQVKATHNSYHQAPLVPLHPSHAYTHPPLDVQLEDYGVRAFELDLHRDGETLEVYHISTIDSATSCDTLVDCLSTIKTWSNAHVDHLPIMVWFEIKDSTGGAPIDNLLIVDQTILDVFPAARVLTPDQVQGGHESLRAAIEADGWPTLAELRGKIMFMVLNSDHPAVADYTYDHTSLLGRMMFVDTDPADFDAPYAAVAKINDPASPDIAAAHAAGILVASNICAADQDDADCFAELEAGKQNGVHNLKDDRLTPKDGGDYFLDLPDGNPARCNQVTAPPECTSVALEDL